jgi:hypothetical protein
MVMHIVVDAAGEARCVYGEAIDLASLGALRIRRASHVEPDDGGAWRADLSPVGGPMLGPFVSRGPALAAEHEWLCANWLLASCQSA